MLARGTGASKYFGWAPSNFANLELWLGADQLGLNDNDSVSSWNDQSGNGRTFTVPSNKTAPVFKTSIINGLPVVRFNGGGASTQHLWNTSSVFRAAAFTIFIAFKWQTATGSPTGDTVKGAFSCLDRQPTQHRGYNLMAALPDSGGSGESFIHGNNTDSAEFFGVEDPRNTTAHLSVTTNDGTTASVYKNGTLTSQNTQPVDYYGDSVLSLATYFSKDSGGGNLGGQSLPGDPDIAEFVFYSRALSGNERGAVTNYFTTKYNF